VCGVGVWVGFWGGRGGGWQGEGQGVGVVGAWGLFGVHPPVCVLGGGKGGHLQLGEKGWEDVVVV
jgi:hypothetical protein